MKNNEYIYGVSLYNRKYQATVNEKRRKNVKLCGKIKVRGKKLQRMCQTFLSFHHQYISRFTTHCDLNFNACRFVCVMGNSLRIYFLILMLKAIG